MRIQLSEIIISTIYVLLIFIPVVVYWLQSRMKFYRDDILAVALAALTAFIGIFPFSGAYWYGIVVFAVWPLYFILPLTALLIYWIVYAVAVIRKKPLTRKMLLWPCLPMFFLISTHTGVFGYLLMGIYAYFLLRNDFSYK